MGNSSPRAVDHLRTTRPHAGESITNRATWPGYLLVGAGLVATAWCLAAFATGHLVAGISTGLIAVVAVVSGVMLRIAERRRVRRIEEFPEVQPPAAD